MGTGRRHRCEADSNAVIVAVAVRGTTYCCRRCDRRWTELTGETEIDRQRREQAAFLASTAAKSALAAPC